ncbi:MAG: fasciclin domain-containing protein [Anaerolineae bacterium]|nr:fasciclin domain-containing protein [Candidatus Roseilinea sp.]MDW8451211.1 fasciclin domain-containing protein [Anaerolineae bacterium]
MSVNLLRIGAALGVVVMSAALVPVQPAAANITRIQISACPKGISIQVVEEDLNLPAPQVSFNIQPSGPGASANLVGSTTNDVPGGVGRLFVYWNEVALTPGAKGDVIARGARNESYASFIVDAECPPLGSVRGSAFEDLNRNGVRDPGEPGIGTASWKLTAGGDWFICGVVGGDSTFGPTVLPGTYSVIPIAQPGWLATTPPRTALVRQLGFASLSNDIGFVRAPGARGDICGQYAPAPAPPQPLPPLPSQDAAAILTAFGSFNTLLLAAEVAGVRDIFSAPGPYIFLAPTDVAFDRVPPTTLNRLLNDPNRSSRVLRSHIIPGVIDATAIGARGRTFRTLGGRTVTLRVRNGVLYANNAVVGEIAPASNGAVFVIDRVLFIN